MTDWQDSEAIRFMLDDTQTWAVVGLSGDPSRTAYRIAALLQEHGKRIVPIHPSAITVLGEPAYATLADVPFPIDVVESSAARRRPASSPTRRSPSERRGCGSSSASSMKAPSDVRRTRVCR